MGTFGGLWGPLGAYGGLWGPMGAYGGLWGSMGTYWGLWWPMGTYRGLLGTFGGLGGTLGAYGSTWGPMGTYHAPKAQRSGVGECPTPDAPRPGKRRPPRAPSCLPHSAQSELAGAHAVGLVTAPHARTPRTHSQWVVGPGSTP